MSPQATLPASKPVAASRIDNHVYKIFPNDLNSNKTAFGGLIMSIADRVAVVAAERHSGCVCVTAGVDSWHFVAPARENDTLVFSVSVNRAWHSSMEVGVRVEAENSYEGTRKHIVSAYFTFVAVDSEGKPLPVPTVHTETALEEQRWQAAELRRQARLATRESLKALRAQTPAAR